MSQAKINAWEPVMRALGRYMDDTGAMVAKLKGIDLVGMRSLKALHAEWERLPPSYKPGEFPRPGE